MSLRRGIGFQAQSPYPGSRAAWFWAQTMRRRSATDKLFYADPPARHLGGRATASSTSPIRSAKSSRRHPRAVLEASEGKCNSGFCPPAIFGAAESAREPRAELAIALHQRPQRETWRQTAECLTLWKVQFQARLTCVMDRAGVGQRCRTVLGFDISETTVGTAGCPTCRPCVPVRGHGVAADDEKPQRQWMTPDSDEIGQFHAGRA